MKIILNLFPFPVNRSFISESTISPEIVGPTEVFFFSIAREMPKQGKKSGIDKINPGSADQQSEMNKSESIVNMNENQDKNDNNNQDESESDEDENQSHDDNSETEKKSEKKEENESEIHVLIEINHESTSAIQDSVAQTETTQQATGEKTKENYDAQIPPNRS